MDLKTYLRRFKSLKGVFAAGGAVAPLLSLVLPEGARQYLVPPLEPRWIVWATVLLLVPIPVLYYEKDRAWITSKDKRSRLMKGLWSLALLGCLGSLAWWDFVVRRTELPEGKGTLVVVVGLKRTEFAQKMFSGQSDEEMLKHRAWTEEEVRRLWEPWTVVVAKVVVLVLYLMFLGPLVAASSLSVLFDCLDSPRGAEPP